jgi:hypothetical protein
MDPEHEHSPEVAAVLAEEHPTWGDHETHLWQKLDLGWIATTWLLAMLLGAVFAAVATSIIAMLADTPITGETNTELGIAAVIGAISTFLAFAVVVTFRLVRVEHHRLVNSLSVGVFHVLVAIAAFAVELVLQAAGVGLGDMFDGPGTDEVGNVFATFERSSVGAILGCLLAVGMVPATGERPRGTQVDITPQDRQL